MSEQPFTGRGPRTGFFGLGIDLAQKQDASTFVEVSCVEREIDPASRPVRDFVVEHIEKQQGTRDRPLELDALVRRAIKISEAFPPPKGSACPIIFDQFLAVEVAAKLRAAGYVELQTNGHTTTKDFRKLIGRKYHQAPMNAAAQTARWRLLREIIHGRRLHIPRTPLGVELVQQLSQMRAWELPNGLLRLDGVEDDLVDALALALEVVSVLPANELVGNLEKVYEQVGFDPLRKQIIGGGVRYFTRDANGNRVPAEMPRSDRNFDRYARNMIAQGMRTPRIVAWEQEQAEETSTIGRFNVRVR